CSNSGNYIESLSDLEKLYIARGYPYALVRKWIKDNSAKRWANRLEKSTSQVSDDPTGVLLVLKSTLNPVWEMFNVHELADVVVKRWTDETIALRARWSLLWNSGLPKAIEGRTATAGV
ncbi:hypothetical protein, partial [Brucella sp. 10RB9214]|uniref:hypothetical protein n=1 Tax=Brucella sp. 10RB9214 TaxID=1844040 RepID=UPI0019D60381